MTATTIRTHALITAIALAAYIPFLNQPFTMDSDMLVHVARQTAVNPINPPLGAYGKNMILHDATLMPLQSVYKRCAHPPLLPLMLAPIARVAGTHEWPFHLAMFVFYLGAIYGGWYLFGLLFPRPLQVYGTLVWALSPALLTIAHTVMWDVPITALNLWILALFLDGIRRERPAMIAACGIVTGLAAITKTNCLPLYIVIGGYLLAAGKFRFFFLWLPGALVFPLAWIMHNIIVFGKIQYISTGLFHPILGDVRYRFERNISSIGGGILFPLWWYWLFLKSGRLRRWSFAVFGATALWSGFLWGMLKFPVWYCFTYWVFSSCGCLVGIGMAGWLRDSKASAFRRDRMLVFLYALLYAVLMHGFPSASIRYMLPLLPCAVIVMLHCMQSLSPRALQWFRITNLTAVAFLSIGLSVCNYLLGQADRALPACLLGRGCLPSNTWYFGRLSFDYYLFQGGFQNLLTSGKTPQNGDYSVDESIPDGYPLAYYVPAKFTLEMVDTLRYFSYPLRSHGAYAGFDGESRLPYTLNWHKPVRQYVLYRLRKKAGFQ
jgi:hypothetical protein